jgi:hypothetical protein
MKKIFTLLVVALLGLSVQAQIVTITKKDGSVVTFQAGEIRNIQFAPSAAKPDTTVLRELTGYLMVTSGFFPSTYYGDAAKMKVMMVEKQQLVQFSDPMWGTGLFNITLTKGQISGSGKLAVPNQHGGGVKEYDATMSGKMTEIAISVPTLMGGTTITWHNGKPAPAVKIVGSYQGDDKINVGGMFPYTSADKVTYKVEANADGTINLVVPEVKYNGTVMGDLTLGTYTIKNIPYDETQKAFVKAYKDDNIKFLFTIVKDGNTTQKEYTFDKPFCKVMVSKDDKGVFVVNNTYQMGAMPMLINGTFKSSK